MLGSARSEKTVMLGAENALGRFRRLMAPLVAATIKETGFNQRDSRELVEAVRSVLQAFLDNPTPTLRPNLVSPEPDVRRIEMSTQPMGGVAIVLPQNAFPYMAVLAGLSAVAGGNRVWLKAPQACLDSAALLEELLETDFEGQITLSQSSGREFVDWSMSSPDVQMIHFIGSSDAASGYLNTAFEAGKSLLIDGDGNCQVYVSDAFDPDSAGSLLAQGSTRFNGQTCTSTVGAVVHPDVYAQVVASLTRGMRNLKHGDPQDQTVDIGPLFSSTALEFAAKRIQTSGGRTTVFGESSERLMAATLVESPDKSSDLVRSGVFAPALWITPGTLEDFEDVWSSNRYPLCAGVLSNLEAEQQRMASLPRLSRLTVNGDTSVEDPLEPWGACPASGNGKVEPWIARYQRTVQLDLPS